MTALEQLVVTTVDAAAGGRSSSLHVQGPRGSGKSWWLDRAGNIAAERGMTTARIGAVVEDRQIPFGALSMLLAPFIGGLDDPAWAILRPIMTLDHRRVDPVDVKHTAFQFLCTLAAEQPICLLLDDVHWFDAESLDVLAFAARRTDVDAIAFISTSTQDRSTIGSTTVRLQPTSPLTIHRMLVANGLDDGVANRCVDAAYGNPGIAIALADGLTDAQRAGTAPVSLLPRPSGNLIDELQNRLRAHGDAVCRSLVVAAAEHHGTTAAVRAALATLGEPFGGLDEAESLGLLEIVGSRFGFTDPWVRSVAYHLVAPSSRRAAHRALAAWFANAEQAAERAWHLAAGADGPNHAVAEALELVAVDAARRGGLATAALTAERASEFATTPQDRQQHLLAALRWWIDTASTDGVRRVLRSLDPLDHDAAAARAEAVEFLDGGFVPVNWEDAPVDGPWTRQRSRRLAVETACEQGDHRTALRTLGDTRSLRTTATDLLSTARALRHSGRTRDARDAATAASAILEHSDSFRSWTAFLVGADLDILQGRGDDAISTIQSIRDRLPRALQEYAITLMARARLQRDPNLSPTTEPAAFTPLGTGALGEIREAIRSGVLNRDQTSMQLAIDLAEQHSLPIEAGEGRLWLSELQPADDRSATIKISRAGLQRSGVRAWDQRLALLALLAEETSPRHSPRRADPGLSALSQAEFRVAEAVANGLTNREAAATLIISVKTVDFHLQQMYRKLGIRSRTELAVRMTNFEPPQGSNDD